LQYATKDEFGVLSYAELQIEGPLQIFRDDRVDKSLSIVLSYQEYVNIDCVAIFEPPASEFHTWTPDQHLYTNPRSAPIRPDIDPEGPGILACHALASVSVSSGSIPNHYAMLLRSSVSQPDKFVRIGLLKTRAYMKILGNEQSTSSDWKESSIIEWERKMVTVI
jgi:hypothetical protein